MAIDGLKLTYNQSLLRVRLAATVKTCRNLSQVPEDITARMNKKLKSEKEKGLCIDHVSYISRFAEILQKVKEIPPEQMPDDFEIHMTIGAGVPVLSGLEFKGKPQKGSLGHLTANIPKKKILSIHPKSFYLHLEYLVKKSGIEKSPCQAQVNSIYNRISSGIPLSGHHLLEAISMEKRQIFGGSPYTFLPQESNSEIKLVIFDISPFIQENMINRVFSILETKAKSLRGKTTIWRNFIRSEISLAVQGVERFGLSLPLSLLAASMNSLSLQDKSQAQESTKNPTATKPADSKNGKDVKSKEKTGTMLENYPGRGALTVSISDDKMHVQVVGFKMALYDGKDFKPTDLWFKKEVQRLKLRNYNEGNIKRAVDNIRRMKDINGIVLAEGVPGDPAKMPYIRSTDEPLTRNGKDEQVNHRDKQANLKMVKKDALIAEIAFRIEAKSGSDIFGNSTPPPPAEMADINLGEGVRLDGTQFYAEYDGALVISGLKIKVIKTLIDEGDVNLASGNLDFDGPIQIKGSIDTGARVYSTKDILIEGHIRGGSIKSGKDIKVSGGVITGQKGSIVCGGDLHSDFIENSIIYCKGNITVQKAILSSKIYCNEKISILNADGILAASEIVVGANIETGDLGFGQGRSTIIYLGYDWKKASSIDIRTKRLEHFSNALVKMKMEVTELTQRNKRSMSKKHLALKAELHEKVARIKRIIKKLEVRCEEATKKVEYNENAYVSVRRTMFTTCQIFTRGEEIPSVQKIDSVVVVAIPHKESHFVSMNKFIPNPKKNFVA